MQAAVPFVAEGSHCSLASRVPFPQVVTAEEGDEEIMHVSGLRQPRSSSPPLTSLPLGQERGVMAGQRSHRDVQ
ncbi:MAG: hypothetical protein Q7S29_03390 [Candidatus Peribacter sp.]|nr:hypothetical protein [Candidatus Peribacter sp.]